MTLPLPEDSIESKKTCDTIGPVRNLEEKDAQPEKTVTASLTVEDTERQHDNVGPYAAPRSKFRTVVIMAALFLSLFLSALDVTIVTTAIPTIASEFNSATGYTWIGSAYLLGMSAASPIIAKLSDIWGRKPILLSTVALFFCSSIICASSRAMGQLIAGRAIQGGAGGGLIVLVNICISDIFSVRQRGLFLGMLECVWAFAGGVGPVLGGTFTELVSWRWMWWINLPLSAATFVALLIFLDVHNPRTNVVDGLKAIDWLGTIGILGLTLMLLLGLDFGGDEFAWDSPRVICLIVFGCLMGVFFVCNEMKIATHPLMPLHIMKHQSNAATMVISFVHGFVFVTAEYYLPLYFQSALQFSPFKSGLMLLPTILAESICGILSGVIMHKTGRYLELIYTGLVFMTIGFGLFIHLSPTSSFGEIIGFQIVAGIGAGLLFEPPLIALHSLVSQDDTSTATATFGFVRNIASALAIVAGGVVFQNSMELRADELRESGLSLNVTELLTGSAAAANVRVVDGLHGEQRLLVEEVFSWSVHNIWIMVTAISGVGIIASYWIGKHVLKKEHTETVTGLKKKQDGSGIVEVELIDR